MQFQGVYVPLVTPFVDGAIDWKSFDGLIDHCLAAGVHGLVPLGTTGESPALSDDEWEAVTRRTVERVAGRVPVIVGAGANCTAEACRLARRAEELGADAILSVSPYYNRPDQRGILAHFRAVGEASALPVIVYNIPYRTGRNVENDTLRRLAELPTVRGVKDSCGDFKQSQELLLDKPADFSVLTGEDVLFYPTLALGGDGGILAAAHLETERYLAVWERVCANDMAGALEAWRPLARTIPLLFGEPNPAPLKHCLARLGWISSAETRLPLVGITGELAAKLDASGGAYPSVAFWQNARNADSSRVPQRASTSGSTAP